MKMENSDGAISDFGQAIQNREEFIAAYLLRARAHAEKEQVLAAIADYSQVIKLDMNQTEAWYNRAALY